VNTKTADHLVAKTGPYAMDPDGSETPRPKRRRFEAGFKLRVLEEWDRASDSVERAAILRREGIYSSMISDWKRQRREGRLVAEARRPEGRGGPSYAEVERLRRENQRLAEQLAKANFVIEVQGKVHALLEELSKSADSEE
jgi:transposase-like protein